METREKDDWCMVGELFRVENEIDENEWEMNNLDECLQTHFNMMS
jgi:hypothetical protein